MVKGLVGGSAVFLLFLSPICQADMPKFERIKIYTFKPEEVTVASLQRLEPGFVELGADGPPNQNVHAVCYDKRQEVRLKVDVDRSQVAQQRATEEELAPGNQDEDLARQFIDRQTPNIEKRQLLALKKRSTGAEVSVTVFPAFDDQTRHLVLKIADLCDGVIWEWFWIGADDSNTPTLYDPKGKVILGSPDAPGFLGELPERVELTLAVCAQGGKRRLAFVMTNRTKTPFQTVECHTKDPLQTTRPPGQIAVFRPVGGKAGVGGGPFETVEQIVLEPSESKVWTVDPCELCPYIHLKEPEVWYFRWQVAKASRSVESYRSNSIPVLMPKETEEGGKADHQK